MLTRDSILDAARDLIITRGWATVRMEDVASIAGVSRRTVYNEFANRERLGKEVVRREIGGFMNGIRRVLMTSGNDVKGGVRAAVRFALEEAAANPVVKAALTTGTGGGDSLLPYLTTDAEMILAGATTLIEEYVSQHFPELPAERVQWGAEMLARLVLSNIVLPRAPAERVAAGLAEDAVEFLIRGLPSRSGGAPIS